VNAFSDREELDSILDTVAVKTPDLDLLYVISFHSNTHGFWSFRAFDPDCPMAMYVNNANSWLGSGLSFTRSYSLRRNIQYNLRAYIKRQTSRRLDAIFVEQPFKREKGY